MTLSKVFSDFSTPGFTNQIRFFTFVFVLCLGSCKSPSGQIPSTTNLLWPTKSWPVSTPQKEGITAQPFVELHQKTLSGTYGYVDRILVIKNGKIIVNHFYNNDYKTISKGKSGALGCGFKTCKIPSEVHPYNYYHPDFHPYPKGREVHSLQSVTKSIAATLIGVAIQQGKIKNEQQPLLSWFGDYDLSGVDERLKKATLHHLLSMQSGIEWHEQDRPLDDTNTTLQLEKSKDWIQFTLNQPMDAAPGAKWVYSSGGSHLLSGIIKKATGMFIDDYAAKYLFNPLGITDFHWKKTPKGYPDTEGGLFLKAEDLAKIGWL